MSIAEKRESFRAVTTKEQFTCGEASAGEEQRSQLRMCPLTSLEVAQGATNHASEDEHMKGGYTACQNSIVQNILPIFQHPAPKCVRGVVAICYIYVVLLKTVFKRTVINYFKCCTK